jgi:MSHA biogenesis protein MshP
MSKYLSGNKHKQQGFTIVMAIFILVVLALLGTYMMRFSGVEHATSTYALQGARAYQASKAGLGWATAKIMKESGTCATVNAQTALTFSDLSGFTVGLSCTTYPDPLTPCTLSTSTSYYKDGSENICIYVITALSEFGTYGNADYVSRKMEATISKKIP